MRWFWLAALIGALPIACSRREPAPCDELTSARPVDAPLLAFLSRARAAHHAADRAEETNDLPRAIQLLTEVTTGPAPIAGGVTPAEVREVLADTLARIAELESRAGDFASAERHIERGLDLAKEATYFRGHLYEVRGLMWERQAQTLRERGDDGGAKSANEKALEALETAMKIQAQVIRESTEKAKTTP